jgi:preprotein translocase subunit SecE
MQLGLTVTAVVIVITVLFAIAGWLIDLSARHFDQSREKRNR